MYIVSRGTVMVVEETDNKKMHLLAELGPGSIFGEIRYTVGPPIKDLQ